MPWTAPRLDVGCARFPSRAFPHRPRAGADQQAVTVQDTPAATAPVSARRKRSATPEPYDFRRPMTLAREHGRVLEMAFETFSRQWGTQLTSRLRVLCQVGFDRVEMRSYDEYVRSLPTMTAMILCDVEQNRSTAVLQLPLDATLQWVDHLLGGPGLPLKDFDRELTGIEWRLVRELLSHALGDLAYAFASVGPIDVRARSVQYNPQFVQAAAASEPVIVASFTVEVNGRSAAATLMIPADVLLAALQAGEKLDSRSADALAEHRENLALIASQVDEVPMSVAVRFRPLTVTPGTIADLAVGDVVTLRHRADEPLDVVVGDVPLARAALGSNGSRLACMVVTSEENH